MSASKSPTGRRAASQPNVQPLPLNTPEAKRIREAFALTSTGRVRSDAPQQSNRPKSKYVPEFKGPIEGWVVNHLKDNAWKVARTMQFADCLQEAYIVFMRVCERYPDVEDAPHFMALFKTSWERYFIDLARHDRRVREVELPLMSDPGPGEDAPSWEPVGELQNEGELAVLLRQAPREVVMVLNLLLRAPQELLELALASWRGEDRRMRAGGSEKINRLLGLPEHYDSLGAVRDHFREHLH